jgi:hypothetical protein
MVSAWQPLARLLNDPDLDEPDGTSAAALDWLRTASVQSDPYLVAEGSAQSYEMDPVEAVDAARKVLSIAEQRGFDVLTIDLTRTDLDVPVCRVLVPGLLHFWPRLGAPRIYEAPVRLGWCGARISEADLNPRGVCL